MLDELASIPLSSDHIAVRESAIHGKGLFALREVPAGQVVGVYEGRRIPADAQEEWDSGLTYLFRLSDGTLIDGRDGGNATRHINHSCEPNCAAYEVERPDDGQLMIVIETTRTIAAGEELYLDYALEVDDTDASCFSCACGASRCRGSMVAP